MRRYVGLIAICLILIAVSLSGCGSSSSTSTFSQAAATKTAEEECRSREGGRPSPACIDGAYMRQEEEANGTYSSNSEPTSSTETKP